MSRSENRLKMKHTHTLTYRKLNWFFSPQNDVSSATSSPLFFSTVTRDCSFTLNLLFVLHYYVIISFAYQFHMRFLLICCSFFSSWRKFFSFFSTIFTVHRYFYCVCFVYLSRLFCLQWKKMDFWMAVSEASVHSFYLPSALRNIRYFWLWPITRKIARASSTLACLCFFCTFYFYLYSNWKDTFSPIKCSTTQYSIVIVLLRWCPRSFLSSVRAFVILAIPRCIVIIVYFSRGDPDGKGKHYNKCAYVFTSNKTMKRICVAAWNANDDKTINCSAILCILLVYVICIQFKCEHTHTRAHTKAVCIAL